MPIEKDDWRLRNQLTYLKGVTWRWSRFPDDASDHEHCEFCWAKLMAKPGPDILLEGYVSPGGRWICKTCFDDFKDMFGWHRT